MLSYFRNMPSRRARKNNDGQQPQPAEPLNENVSHAEFWADFQALAQAVTANIQANPSLAPQQLRGDSAAARIHDFMRINLPKFYGSKSDKDPWLFLEKVRKITQVMHVSEEHSVELAAHRLKDLAYDWVVAWTKDKGEGALPTTWQEFQDAFLDKFFPLEMREAKVEEFMNLR